jgi:hypothetical protein
MTGKRILVAALAGAALTGLGTAVASSHAAPKNAHELLESESPQNATFGALVARSTYSASLVVPSPNVKPPVLGWSGTQFVSHAHGKVRYETAAFLYQDYGGREIDILSGPAMTLSPAATIALPRSRIPGWNFSPYQPPGPVQRWTIAGRTALYFDATAPPPGVWTLVGANPPELRIDHDHSFRMAALTVRGKTIVVVIQAPEPQFVQFLPIAKRFLASLEFPAP